MKQVHLIVSGKVQGVGFRYFAQMKAIQYSIAGWVRNRQDGTVEMVAVGSKDQLDSFIKDIKRGNPFSQVYNVEMSESNEIECFKSFTIKY